MLIWMAAAFALLAEAMIAVAFGRNWHATWWEWHLLMLAAFGLVAWSAHRQWHEERFSDLYLDETTSGKREISVLFADLQGFTSFSEAHDPREVTAMLNEYFQVAIPPVVRRSGGEIDRIVGDALMATFNRRGDQPDHAPRRRAALEPQQAREIAAAHPGWPRFGRRQHRRGGDVGAGHGRRAPTPRLATPSTSRPASRQPPRRRGGDRRRDGAPARGRGPSRSARSRSRARPSPSRPTS